jgi:ribosomal protein S18 acetylase RimI-like enzyme
MATVYTRHGLAVIGGVGTDPAFRRRGIGSWVTAEALLDARRRGYEIATLQASEAGMPVYERLGFVRVGWYERWTTAGAAPMVAPPEPVRNEEERR